MDLQEVTLQSSDGAYARQGWFHAGPVEPHALGVMLDGEFYLERADAWSVIDALTEAGRIPPSSWLFIASGGAEARHADFIYSERYANFVAEDAVDWARPRVRGIRAEGHLIGGLSLSGLAAAHTALLHADRFCSALCQSGSFWLEPERFAALVAERPPRATRFWLSVGDEETEIDVSHPPTGLHQAISQIDGVLRARDALAPAADAVHCHCYSGGHDFAPWQAELGEALEWLLA